MAHIRKRYLTPQIQQALRFSPLVGVLGQRQVGKTTLLEQLTESSYETMDDQASLTLARSRPQGYLDNFNSLTAIDECQKAPELFPALKLLVQKNKKPGQFILSGSVRFTSRKAIQESLTGRIFNLELLPMTLAEGMHLPFLNYTELFSKDFQQVLSALEKRQKSFPKKHIDRYMRQGGLPGICFLREESHRRSKLKSHLETLLQRDIQFITKTTAPYESIRMLLSYIANTQGQPFVLKDASQQSRLAQNTVKKLLEAFEGLFLIRRVVGIGFRTAPLFFLEDQGMASYLMNDSKKNYIPRFLFSQIFPNVHYSNPHKYQIGYFENKSGLKIDLVASLESMEIGFLYENAESPSAHTLRTAESFLNDRGSSAKVILLSESKKGLKVDKNILQLPLHWII